MVRSSIIALSTFAVAVFAAPQSESASTSESNAPFSFGPASSETNAPFTFGPDSTTVQGATTAAPSGPVITITVPGGLDDQIYLGSLVGITSQLTTVAFNAWDDSPCFTSLATDGCTREPLLTVTAGSSSYRYSMGGPGSTFTIDADCKFSAGGGSCVEKDTGAATNFVTETGSNRPTPTGMGSSTSSTTFGADYLKTGVITITAGDLAALTMTASATPTGGSGGSSSSSVSHAGQTTSSVAGSTNGVKALTPGAVAAGLVGLAALIL